MLNHTLSTRKKAKRVLEGICLGEKEDLSNGSCILAKKSDLCTGTGEPLVFLNEGNLIRSVSSTDEYRNSMLYRLEKV